MACPVRLAVFEVNVDQASREVFVRDLVVDLLALFSASEYPAKAEKDGSDH